uniref:(northern house mosquito) hypothetical protein n=1 Tax=Culex pipiens TaxID=7175 RepID=A0A8D8IYP0_CULPI
MRREPGRHLRQSVRLVVAGHYRTRDGRVTASAVRPASDACALPHSPQSAAPAQVQEVVQEVPRIHRYGASERLSSTALHGTVAEAPVHQGAAHRKTSADTAERPYR